MDTADEILADLRDMVDPDGGNAGDVVRNLAAEYGVPEDAVWAIYERLNRL